MKCGLIKQQNMWVEIEKTKRTGSVNKVKVGGSEVKLRKKKKDSGQ